jgi:hypothetical protein
LYLKNGKSYSFQNIEKNEYEKLVTFIKSKDIKMENEIPQNVSVAKTLMDDNLIGGQDDSDEEDDDFDGGKESSSEDEDFEEEDGEENPTKKRKLDNE